MGNGKTLTAVTLSYLEHTKNGKQVIANTHLTFPYTQFNREWFLENLATEEGELHDCVLILDETYLYMDSSHRSKSARLFTYFVGQTRKRNVDLYICTHHIDVIDKRIRRAIDVRGTCRYLKEDPCRKCGGTGHIGKKGRELRSTDIMAIPLSTPEDAGPLDEEEQERVSKELQPSSVGVLEPSTSPITGETLRQINDASLCPRCLGYGKTGWATTKFLDLRSGRRTRIRIFGPAFWGLYDTTEIVPLTAKQMKIGVEDL